MADMVRMDEDVKQYVERLKAREKERQGGGTALADARAVNWLAREGAKAMGLATPVGKKVKP